MRRAAGVRARLGRRGHRGPTSDGYTASIPTGVFTLSHAASRLPPLPRRGRRGAGGHVELGLHRRRALQPRRGRPADPARVAVPAARAAPRRRVPGPGHAVAAVVELASPAGGGGAVPAGVPAAGLRGRRARRAGRYGGPDRRPATAPGGHGRRPAARRADERCGCGSAWPWASSASSIVVSGDLAVPGRRVGLPAADGRDALPHDRHRPRPTARPVRRGPADDHDPVGDHRRPARRPGRRRSVGPRSRPLPTSGGRCSG